jgi:glyoxylase-like metal-dependent hydrolase (beta-lactamase superfamily II)
LRLIDVRHLGRERVIGCWQVDDVLIDPGPESSMQNLIEELGEQEPRALLLTHIHLDHAGAAGALVRHWPHLEVYVHEVGAPHLADPTKLLQSAERLYGDRMQELWGEVVPVPEENLKVLSGGESLARFDVAYTPGHASHHVCYFHREGGAAFVGDVAGVRIPPCDLLLAPTPPPDIDVDAWLDSMQTVRDWSPRSLHITHFGQVDDPAPHLDAFAAELRGVAGLARELDGDDFERRIRERMASCGEETGPVYVQALPPEQQFLGLDRYWSKRSEAPSD